MNARDALANMVTRLNEEAGGSPYSISGLPLLLDAFRAEMLNEAADELDSICEGHGVLGVGNRLRRMAAARTTEKATASAPTATPQPDPMVFAEDLVKLAPARTVDVERISDGLHLDLVATREQWKAWADALAVDPARTTHRGGTVTSHATWRGVHIAIRCHYTGSTR